MKNHGRTGLVLLLALAALRTIGAVLLPERVNISRPSGPTTAKQWFQDRRLDLAQPLLDRHWPRHEALHHLQTRSLPARNGHHMHPLDNWGGWGGGGPLGVFASRRSAATQQRGSFAAAP